MTNFRAAAASVAAIAALAAPASAQKDISAPILNTPGNAAASGRLWIDGATGSIHQTELSLESSTETGRIVVTYARDPSLDLWLPATMFDDYGISQGTGGISNMGAGGYNSRQAFGCRATYSNPRLTPIDLGAVK